MDGLEIKARLDGNRGFVQIVGIIDHNSSPELKNRLLQLRGMGASALVIDCRPMEFIDSTGLGVLCGVRSELGEDKISLHYGGNEKVRRIFRVLGLNKLFPESDKAFE